PLAPPVPGATGRLTGGGLAAGGGTVAATRQRARRRAASRARVGRFIAGPPAGCDGSPRSLVHDATFGQVCPSSGCLPQSRSSTDFLGFTSPPATRASNLA